MENVLSWIMDNYIILTVVMSVLYVGLSILTKIAEKKQRKEKNNNGRDSSGNSGNGNNGNRNDCGNSTIRNDYDPTK